MPKQMEIIDGVKFTGHVDSVKGSDISQVLMQMTPDQRAHVGLPAQFPIKEKAYDSLAADREVRTFLERTYARL